MHNNIMALQSGGSLVEDVVRLKSLVLDHFKVRFKELSFRRPKLENVSFKKLSSKERSNLEIPFSLADIKEVIWVSAYNKSLGPNEFKMNFYEAS